jgi:hypothetical protein
MKSKFWNYAVPFLMTVSAVLVGLGIYKVIEKRGKKVSDKAKAAEKEVV